MSIYLGKTKVNLTNSYCRGLIRIHILNGIAGIVATATLENSTYTVQGTSDANGKIILSVENFGKYHISYSNVLVHGGDIAIVKNNISTEIYPRYSTLMEYTVCIDETNSNPLTCCTYTDDALNMTKGSSDWDSMPIFEDIRPCVFKDGAVNYYINPDDFTKKYNPETGLNTGDAILTGADGDVMIEFAKFAYRIYRENDVLYVSITNDPSKVQADSRYTYDAFSRVLEGDLEYFYQGAFKGYIDENGDLRSIVGVQPTANQTIVQFRQAAQKRNNNHTFHYQQSTYAHLKAIQCLYLIKYGNLNSQSAVGQGITGVTDDGESNLSYITGYNGNNTEAISTLDKGMFYGGTSTKQHVKVFGIEDLWGNIYEWVDGLTTDASWNIITSYNSFSNDSPTAQSISTPSGRTSNANGYIYKVAGNSAAGFMPVEFGSPAGSSTFWCDRGYLYSSRVLRFGGLWLYGAYAGAFQLSASSSSGDAGRGIGARLTSN